MSLFEGHGDAYGTYKMTGEVQGKKQLGRAATIRGPVTVELWHDHLIGKYGIGIIPINRDNMVRFAAIDVDQYPINFQSVNERVLKFGLPLVPCVTKSQGLHLYMFLSEWTSAKEVQAKMRELASMLGFGDCEIFPKQVQVNVDRGDLGQWINVPYFLGDRTSRYALRKDHQRASISEFIELAKSKSLTREQLQNLKVRKSLDLLPEGPPCLNCLAMQGFPPGTRNQGLYNLGVYCKRAHPTDWNVVLERMNNDFMDPPLGVTEVLGIMKSLGKKDWNYTCDQQPIKPHCDRDECKRRAHGVGGPNNGFPKFGTLTKFATDPPIWFLEVEGGGRLELSTEDLQDPLRFQRRCMAQLNVMPTLLKRNEWMSLVQRLLEDVCTIEVPRESTPAGMLRQLLEEFCTSRVAGKTPDELILGKPLTKDGRHYFRMRDLMQYLERHKFRESLHWVSMHLRDLGAEKHFFNVRGAGINCIGIPEFKQVQTEPFPTPKVGEQTPY